MDLIKIVKSKGGKNKAGKWMEKNEINPEIIIKNQPEVIAKGVDEQLEKSIEVLMKEVE